MAIHEGSRQDREQPSSRLPSTGAALLALESARGDASVHRPTPEGDKDGERISLFWRVFGGTLLSIAALVIITLTQQFAHILTEVRQDLNRMHVSRGELARREEVSAALKDLQTAASGIAALRERSLLLEQQLKGAEAERGQLAREVRELRERLAEAGGRQSVLHSPDVRSEPRAGR